MRYIDTHSHFNLSQFDSDREAAIARMVAADVGTFCIGVDEETSAKAVELASKYDNIWAIVGQHPTEWVQEFDLDAFISLAGQPKVVAIGECGLDYFREREQGHKDEQKKLFRLQIELAIETKLPLMLHIRPQANSMNAYDDALELLKAYKKDHPKLTGTSHFFVGDQRIAQEFLDLGFYISFSGVITIFPEYDDIVRFVPLDRILPETDAPFASPLPWRGQRCEPQYVTEVVKKIAEIKELPLEDVQRQLLQNTKTLFYKNTAFR
jgi:TatD DNase family protein